MNSERVKREEILKEKMEGLALALSEMNKGLKFRIRINSESNAIDIHSREISHSIGWISNQNSLDFDINEPVHLKVRLWTGFYQFVDGEKTEEYHDFISRDTENMESLAADLTTEVAWLEENSLSYLMSDDFE